MLSSKQRAFLRGLANDYSAVLTVGKGGVADTLTAGADEALTARELIKGKALEASPQTAREAAEEIAGKLHADVVQVIGRVFVLYRPNPEKKKDQDAVSYKLKRI